MTHICVSIPSIIGSDNGLSPGRHQAIIWTNAGIWLIGPLGTNFSEILIEIYIFSFKKSHLKLSLGNWRQFCLGLNVLIGPLGTNLNELWTNIQPFSCKIMNLKNAVCKCTAVLVRPQCYVFEIALVWVICKSINAPCYDLIHKNWDKQPFRVGHR